jgi:hypothetical protein
VIRAWTPSRAMCSTWWWPVADAQEQVRAAIALLLQARATELHMLDAGLAIGNGGRDFDEIARRIAPPLIRLLGNLLDRAEHAETCRSLAPGLGCGCCDCGLDEALERAAKELSDAG